MSNTWLITGASRGLGRIVTEKLLARGDTVAATARNTATIADLKDAYRNQVFTARLDVTKAADVRRVTRDAFAALGHIDVVISNAGFGIYAAAEEISDEQLQHIVATNLLGSMALARAAIPHLREQGGGRIIQMSSMAGHFGRPGFSAYHATKWGIEGFFEAIAEEVAPLGISTSVLVPGRFPTTFYEAAERPDRHPAYADNPQLSRDRGDLRDMPGDQNRLADAIIAVGDMRDAPRRIVFGSDAFIAIHDALSARVRDLERQKALAYSTDRVEASTPQI